MKLWLDFETYCETPINNGTYRYAASAEITLFAWAIDDAPAQVWDLTDGSAIPPELLAALKNPEAEVWAHNSMFDRTVMRSALPDICPHVTRWRDTMVQAFAHSLPGKLATLCEVLGVKEDLAKAKHGNQLVMLFCKPRPLTSKVRRANRDTHPTEWAAFVDYARLDVEAMREVHRLMPIWNYRSKELALWHLDQTINDRGICVDLELANAALDAVAQEQLLLTDEAVRLTSGAVGSATQRDKMLAHMLEEYGVPLPNLQMATVERRLDDPDIPTPMKDLLRVRLQASTSSTSKYKALVRASNLDGRLRGLLQFAGASRTGRWCLAEDSQVRVRSGGVVSDKAIQNVLPSDEVWDGAEWVSHEGVVFSGVKPVIRHDGVMATAEHIVYLSDTEKMPLGQAAALGLRLWRGALCT